ncbi:dual specificity protein phosphatase 19 [Agrilus planipennis]|uniref:Dual specificity protein phosphatase 19 n=1 Tax=Agrilus planipennis TaxID=224129 RepID=A0A1W4XPB0_AGRPL|nr:dual specificity protein phosphatase 19 [Agrilus planipennis]
MSFLEELRRKRKFLKTTETIVTKPDGRRFKENSSLNETTEIDQKTYGFVIDYKPDNIPSKITDNIFLGSQDCCEDKVLHQHSITHVLSIGVQAPNHYPDVVYEFVPCLDLPETNIKDKLVKVCIPFLSSVTENNCKALVHCNAGISRSATVVIGFLILHNNYTYEEAYALVKQARSCIKPNAGFQTQLKYLKT